MKFSDFDFQSIRNLMNSMSDEEMESLNDMAQKMVGNLSNQPQEESDEVISWIDYLKLSPDVEDTLCPDVQDALESASDLEQFYEEDSEADQSGAALFYAKAITRCLRHGMAPLLNELGVSGFEVPNQVSLYPFVAALNRSDVRESVVQKTQADTQRLEDLAGHLMSLYTCMQKAESDVISQNELQMVRQNLIQTDMLNWLSSFSKTE